MKTSDIAEMLEKFMVDNLTERLFSLMTITDLGERIKNGQQVYTSVLRVALEVTSDTHKGPCMLSPDPVSIRRESDKDRLRLVAKSLLGIEDLTDKEFI